MDVLAAMGVFVRVAELGSLSAAGRDLKLSQPAVSQKISALEQHLGVRLVNRTTRQLALTEAGRTYYARAKPVLAAVDEAAELVAGAGAPLTGHLRIQAPTGFGQMYLADIAIAFQLEHPGLTFELMLDDRYVDLTEQAVDLALRFGTLRSSGLIARRFGTLRRILVAAPAYLARHGAPDTPEHLSTHRQVRFSGAAVDDTMPLTGPAGSLLVPVQTSFLANNTFVLTKALVAGLGLGGAQLPQIRAELAAGQLVQIMPDYQYAPLDVHAVYPTSHFVPAKVRLFVEHLRRALSEII
ncbi:LysR family transcriptional regulator [Devosia neptuniae]|uniref:LysR family transcriptional regulator n=1 Tax=Devosia neptuniae TaxID=191302 RepID=A0ABY6C8D1_9HYPH|nr:LysR family transcriptional regulator [Devosia neptuniae]UXN68499.1 LysR family transcriptional regulator [Devosia neptuniae]